MARKKKRKLKRRSAVATALRGRQYRQRVKPGKHKLASWSGDTIMRLFEVERF